MPIVKHNNRFVENNPREISDCELARYVKDGWYINQEEYKPLPVQTPVEVITESVKSETVVVLPVVNVEPVKTETVSTKSTDQYFTKQRGRPRKF